MAQNRKPQFPKLDAIRSEMGDAYFVMACTHIFDAGYRNFDDETIANTIEGIREKDDTHDIMTNDFKVMLVEKAYEISKAAQILEIVKYVSKIIA